MTDVAIVGDGPAGSALAFECATRDLDVVLIGRDDVWTATYASWVDEVPDRWVPALRWTTPSIAVHTDRSIPLERPYGVFDNERLRRALRVGVTHIRGSVDGLRRGSAGAVLALADGREVIAATVVDATGWPPALANTPATRRDRPGDVAYQTAFGVVLESAPDGDLGEPTWMDFRDPGERRSERSVPTFCYSLPVADGWLVEETVLAARPAVEPVALLPRLARRLGRQPDELLDRAVRTEYVRIPMGGGAVPWRTTPATFGAAAGYVNPVSGFSVAASLRRAPVVADALTGPARSRADAVAAGVWPRAMRRTRALHGFGLEALLGLDQAGVREFFDRFFDQPTERWAPYLRIDSRPAEVSAAMIDLFRSAPWWLRRHLALRNPVPLARAVSG